MANQAHLQVLASGVAAWNQWRQDNPEVIPDLSGAALVGLDLSSTKPLVDMGDGPVGQMDVDGKPGL